jgi:hypothetical protein
LAGIGLADEIGRIQQPDDLLATIGRGGYQLEYARQQVRADDALIAGPDQRLAARDLAAAAERIQRAQLDVAEAAAKRLVADRAVRADVVVSH